MNVDMERAAVAASFDRGVLRRAGDAGRRDITVKHPEHGETTVKAARDKLDAVTEAARRWGAQWSAIARECSFEEAGRDGEM